MGFSVGCRFNMFGLWWLAVWASVALRADARKPRQFDDQMNIKMLGISVPGTPGEDYPIFSSVPDTLFGCEDKDPGGYYADMETRCQVYHTCGTLAEDFNLITFSRLCPNGTTFHQEGQTCRWWYLVDCESSDSFYFSDSNLRGAEQSSSSKKQSSFNKKQPSANKNQSSFNKKQSSGNGRQSSSGNLDTVSQFGGSKPRLVSIQIPESALEDLQILLGIKPGAVAESIQQSNAVSQRAQQSNPGIQRAQPSNSGSRRVQQNSSGSRRVQATANTQSSSSSNSRTSNTQQSKPAAATKTQAGNRTPDRRTQQNRDDNLNNSVDDDSEFDRRTNNNQPATLPPSKRDFSFTHGKFKIN